MNIRGVEYIELGDIANTLHISKDAVRTRARRRGINSMRLRHRAYYTEEEVQRILTDDILPEYSTRRQ